VPIVVEQETQSGSLTACPADMGTMLVGDLTVNEASASDADHCVTRCYVIESSTNNGRQLEVKGNERSRSGYQELGRGQDIA
jgi:hypothetical protein